MRHTQHVQQQGLISFKAMQLLEHLCTEIARISRPLFVIKGYTTYISIAYEKRSEMTTLLKINALEVGDTFCPLDVREKRPICGAPEKFPRQTENSVNKQLDLRTRRTGSQRRARALLLAANGAPGEDAKFGNNISSC